MSSFANSSMTGLYCSLLTMRGNDRLDNCLTNQLRIAHADAETNLVQQQNCHLDCSLTVQEPEAEQIYLLKDSQFALES